MIGLLPKARLKAHPPAKFALRGCVKLGSFNFESAKPKLSMKTSKSITTNPPCRQRGQSRLAILIAIFIVIDVGLLAYFLTRDKDKAPTPAESQTTGSLQRGTLQVLQDLDAPVEIHFYSILDARSTTEELQAFSKRVDALVQAYRDGGAGNIRLLRKSAAADASDAAADQMTPFNVNLGEPCYLGIVVSRNDRRETIPLLSPEWESALQADLSRAIARVARKTTTTSVTPSTADAKSRAAALEQVRRSIPNTETVSTEEGARVLRQSALEEFKAAAQETERLTSAAQERLAAAQRSGVESEQQTAMRELQQVQQAQAEKLKEIAARSQAQVEAWQELKRQQPQN